MEQALIYVVPALGLVGLLAMAVKSAWVTKQATGDKNMVELSGYIADGAMAFLKAEWKVLGYFAVIAGILLAWSGTLVETSSPVIAISFLIGAFFSALAGYIGMKIATKANVRTTQAARTSLKQALKVSFTGGSVMGLGVAGLAVLGLGALFIVFYQLYVVSVGAGVNGVEMEKALEVLAGFSLGAESIALFARVGGGIYTKAADVGADLVGKVEAGIPEDDVRNPATIADNVGDNVGDVAGMGADLFGSYVATILATMVLGREIVSVDNFGGIAPILLPMVLAGLGIIFSIMGMAFVTIKDDKGDVQKALNMGNWSSIVFTGIASFFIVKHMLPETLSIRGYEFSNMDVFYAIILGLVVGTLMSIITEYYTAMGKRPVLSIIKQSATGHATNIIGGLSVGEPAEEMYAMTEVVCEILPEDKPRYLMGVGTPINILENIALGIDMFDCVMPTRNARNGMLFTANGTINMKNKKWEADFSPIDEMGITFVDTQYTKAYLRHLFTVNELLGKQIATIHNLGFYMWLVREARKHILAGDFRTWKDMMVKNMSQRL